MNKLHWVSLVVAVVVVVVVVFLSVRQVVKLELSQQLQAQAVLERFK